MQTRYQLKVTNTLSYIILILHGLALLLAWATDYAELISGLLTALILFSLYYCLAHPHSLSNAGNFDAFIFEGDRILFYSGEVCISQGRVITPSLVTPFLILFHIRIDGRLTDTRLLLLRDELDAEAYRRLCVSARLV